MNKSLTTAAALLAIATSAHAAGMDGAYAGVQLGHSSDNVKYNETDNSSYNLTIDGLDVKGADYGFFGGYGKTLSNNVYLGGEAEYDMSNADNKLSANGLGISGDVKTSKKHSYGAAARVGYVMGNIMPYARVGYTRSKFEQEVSGVGKDNATKGGVSLGAGLEYSPAPNWGIRGEFVRTSYSKITGSDSGVDYSYKPTETVARVGVSYHF